MSQSPLHLLSNLEKSTALLNRLSALRRNLLNPASLLPGNFTPRAGILRAVIKPRSHLEEPDSSTPRRPLSSLNQNRLNDRWHPLSLHDLTNNLRQPVLSPIRPFSSSVAGSITPLFRGFSPRIFSPIQLRQPMASPNLFDLNRQTVGSLPSRPVNHEQARYDFNERIRQERMGGEFAMPESPEEDLDSF